MSGLELRFLGDIAVIRDGRFLDLPPSKKTRALLAFLALQPRAFRREHLCELLWEIPDDPRGSLRWSLSKLRRVVDVEGRPRIIADRASVRFDPEGVAIDVVRLLELAAQQPGTAPIEALEDAAARYRGNFLEGLELAGFHDFHTWHLAERERVARAQVAVLETLIERLRGEPARALPHARSLVSAVPYDEAARSRLVRLLVTLGHADEAEQQYLLGMRMLKEGGIEPTGMLRSAWRAPRAADNAVSSGASPAASPGPPLGTAGAPPGDLIGRDAECRRLGALYARVAEARRAHMVLLRGDPGIGKSRLVETVESLARDAGAFVLRASAFESEAIRPFALWIDALRKQPTDGSLEIFGAAHRDNRNHLFGALSDLVAAQSAGRPVVLLFDDLQWCDESSAAALHYVARMNHDRALLGVLAAREGEMHDNAPVQQALRGLRHDGLLEELHLGPLSAEATRALIERHAPAVDSARLSLECAGNPLLAIELARAESAGGSGGSLDELVRERLTRFGTEGGEVLLWASVLAPRIDLPSLVRVSGLDAARVAAALEQAERQALLVPAERGLRFSHDLVGRAVYAAISPARRQVMHRRVAELMEQDAALDLERASDLAHHAAQSGDPGLAARAMVCAGRLCLRFFANEEAVNLARRGLELAGELPGVARVCVELDLEDVLLAAAPLDDWERAAARYVALAEQALDHGALAHARLGYHMASYVRWANGHWAGAREQTLQAERVTRGGSAREHIVGMAETAKCLAMLERDLSQADALLMEARALAERQSFSHHAIPTALGMLRYHQNQLDDAEELFMEARALCKSAGDRVNEFQAGEYLVMIAFQRADYAEARHRCAALLALGGRLREGSEAPFARALDALCHYALEDDPAPLTAALDDLRVVDAKYRLAYVLTRAALLDLERERPGEALQRAAEALEAAEILERATEMMLAHLVLAQARLAVGDPAASRRHHTAIKALEQAPVADWARLLAAGLAAAPVDAA